MVVNGHGGNFSPQSSHVFLHTLLPAAKISLMRPRPVLPHQDPMRSCPRNPVFFLRRYADLPLHHCGLLSLHGGVSPLGFEEHGKLHILPVLHVNGQCFLTW